MTPHSNYVHPEALVSTEWVADHLNDSSFCIVESNEDILLYDTGHVPGAVHIDWRRDLQDALVRDYIQPKDFAALCSRHGITPETTVVFYGDKSNWWSCYALWVFRLFGHTNVKVMNGGRDKWIAEGRSLVRDLPQRKPSVYPVPARRLDGEIRAFFENTLAHSQKNCRLSTCALPENFLEKLLTCQTIHRKESCVEATFQERMASHGSVLLTMMALLNQLKNFKKFIRKNWASRQTMMSLPIAVLENAPAIHGLSLPTFLDFLMCVITTVRGLSGEIV